MESWLFLWTTLTVIYIEFCLGSSGGFARFNNSQRAVKRPARAAVFVKHCVTPAPEQQSTHPPHPSTRLAHRVNRVPVGSRHASASLFQLELLLSVTLWQIPHCKVQPSPPSSSTFSPEFPHWWHARVFDRLPGKTRSLPTVFSEFSSCSVAP